MTEIVFTKTNFEEELKEILVLQQENLLRADKINEQLKEGFVTVQHSLTDLQDMHNSAAHCIIKSGNKVIGYALVMLPTYKDKIEILKPFFNKIELLYPRPKNTLLWAKYALQQDTEVKDYLRSFISFSNRSMKKNFIVYSQK